MSTGNGDEGIRRHLSRCWVGPAIRRSREENDWRHNTFVRSWLILFKFKDIYGEGSRVIVRARPLSTSKQGILATLCILRQRYCHIDHFLVSIAIPFATLFFVEWPSCDRRPRAISSTDAILIRFHTPEREVSRGETESWTTVYKDDARKQSLWLSRSLPLPALQRSHPISQFVRRVHRISNWVGSNCGHSNADKREGSENQGRNPEFGWSHHSPLGFN